MRYRGWVRLVLVAGSFVVGPLCDPALALKFVEERVDGREVLWVYDCGARRDSNCSPEQRGFVGPSRAYPGDAKVLSDRLTRARARGGFAEILLWSGGGNLVEGLKVGAVLRQHQATVRVVSGATCASACTVAFMGGLFRFVDPGADFLVHAYSAWLSGFVNAEDQAVRDRLFYDPAAELARIAHGEYRAARTIGAQLFRHFQVALIPPFTSAGDSRVLDEWASAEPVVPYLQSPDSTDPSRPSLYEDARRIRNERDPAVHVILMRLERDAMAQAIEELRPLLPRLGPRAVPALAMLETMFSSEIIRTSKLSLEVLERQGYVTKLVKP